MKTLFVHKTKLLLLCFTLITFGLKSQITSGSYIAFFNPTPSGSTCLGFWAGYEFLDSGCQAQCNYNVIWIPANTAVILTPCIPGGDIDISASLWDGPGPCNPPAPGGCPITSPQDLSYTGCNSLPTGTSSAVDCMNNGLTLSVGFSGILIQ